MTADSIRPPPITMQPYLELVRGRPSGARFHLPEGESTLGRALDASIPLHDDERVLSRIHARIWRRGRRIVLRAEGANGTAVNGHALGAGPRRLAAGDVIDLAGRIALQLRWSVE